MVSVEGNNVTKTAITQDHIQREMRIRAVSEIEIGKGFFIVHILNEIHSNSRVVSLVKEKENVSKKLADV